MEGEKDKINNKITDMKTSLRWTLLAMGAFLFQSNVVAEDQIITFTTQKSVGDTVTLVVNDKASVSVDWGDASPVSYGPGETVSGEVKGPTLTVTGDAFFTSFSCEDAGVTSIDLSLATDLRALYCGHNALTALDVTKNTALTDLDCSYNQLKAINTQKNTKLVYLNCIANEITSFSSVFYNKSLETLLISNNAATTLTSGIKAVKTLWCDENRLKTLTLTQATTMEQFVANDNALTSVNMGGKALLQSVLLDNNNLESLDLSRATTLTTLSCAGNKLSLIDYGTENTGKFNYINCSDNNLRCNSFLGRSRVTDYATNYIYAPQADINVGTVVLTEDTIDLTDTYKNAEGRTVAASYEVYAKDGTALVKGTDWRLISSKKIQFLLTRGDSVKLRVSSKSYPDLVLSSNYFSVKDGSEVSIHSVRQAAGRGLVIRATDNGVRLTAETSRMVRVYSPEGAFVWKGLVTPQGVDLTLPKGVYIINSIKVKI